MSRQPRAWLVAAVCLALALSGGCSSRYGRARPLTSGLHLDNVALGHPCGDHGAYGQTHGAYLLHETFGDDLLHSSVTHQHDVAAAPPPSSLRDSPDVVAECAYGDRSQPAGDDCVRAVDYITDPSRHHLVLADPEEPYACRPPGLPPLRLYERIARALPHARARTDQIWNCDDDAATDVAGAHEAHGCSEIADVDYHPRAGMYGTVTVYQLPSRSALIYQRDLEIRFMRQYVGLRQDVAVPGLTGSRLIFTGPQADLSELLFIQGTRLAMVWLSTDDLRGLSKTDLHYVRWVATNVHRAMVEVH